MCATTTNETKNNCTTNCLYGPKKQTNINKCDVTFHFLRWRVRREMRGRTEKMIMNCEM